MSMNDEMLSRSGIPYNLWHCENPGIEPVDAIELYLAGSNLLLPSDTPKRMVALAWLAQDIGGQMNRYYRLPGEHKRREPTPLMADGTEVSFPFTVKVIGVKPLVDLFKLTDGDKDRDFHREVCDPDFYFLAELGDELEYPNTFGAKVVKEFLLAREAETLPTVVSLAKPPSKVIDKNGDKVYAELAEYLKPAVRVKTS